MDLRTSTLLAGLAGAFLLGPPYTVSQSAETEEGPAENVDESLDEIKVDVQGSIEDVDNRRGISFDGDLRAGHLFTGDGFSDFEFDTGNIFRARWRLGSTWRLRDGLRLVGRVAGLCSTEECSPLRGSLKAKQSCDH